MMYKDLYKEAEEAKYKPITFGLFNKIDDDKIPYTWGKQNKQVYGIDDFVYTQLILDKKEKFLLTMHNKEFLRKITLLKKKYDKQLVIVDVNFDDGEINIIKLKDENADT